MSRKGGGRCEAAKFRSTHITRGTNRAASASSAAKPKKKKPEPPPPPAAPPPVPDSEPLGADGRDGETDEPERDRAPA